MQENTHALVICIQFCTCWLSYPLLPYVQGAREAETKKVGKVCPHYIQRSHINIRLVFLWLLKLYDFSFLCLYFSILHYFLLSLPLQDACSLFQRIIFYFICMPLCAYKCVVTHVKVRGRKWFLPQLLSTLLFGTVSHWTLAKEFSRLCLSLLAEQVGHSHTPSFGFHMCVGDQKLDHIVSTWSAGSTPWLLGKFFLLLLFLVSVLQLCHLLSVDQASRTTVPHILDAPSGYLLFCLRSSPPFLGTSSQGCLALPRESKGFCFVLLSFFVRFQSSVLLKAVWIL